LADDAIEQSDVTAGNSAYSGADLTYAFVQASTFSTYTNTTSSSQNVELYQVNYYAGSGSGSIAPFVATYTGGQDATDVANGNDYNVLVIGDPVNVTAGSGPSTGAFLASGTNPIVTLNPGDVLVAGFNSSGAGVVEINTLGTGLIDYIYNGNALPLSTPDTLTINSSYSLDATVKFNVGFVVSGSGTLTTMTLSSSADPSAQGTNVNFIANISPAPTNGEVVTFMDGTNIWARLHLRVVRPRWQPVPWLLGSTTSRRFMLTMAIISRAAPPRLMWSQRLSLAPITLAMMHLKELI